MLVVEQALRLLVSTMVSSVRVEAVQEVVLADERLGDELQALEETSARAGGEEERAGWERKRAHHETVEAVDDGVGLRHAGREAQVVERADSLEVDVLGQAFCDVVVAELDLVAVPVRVARRQDLGRLEEALEERVVDPGERRAVICERNESVSEDVSERSPAEREEGVRAHLERSR